MADEQINIEVNLKDDASANATVIAERIDNIGDQAAQATRKLAKLKAALVAVDGTSADATVSVKENRSEMDRMGDAAMRADNKIKKSIGGKGGGFFGMINFGFKFKALFSFFKWGAIADGIALIGSSVAALGGAAVGAVAAFTPVLGVAGALPSVIGALGQSMVVLKAGFKGASEVAKPLFEKISSDIEKVVGPSLTKLTKGLLASNGALRNGLVATAKQLKPSIKELDQYLNKGAGKGQMASFMGNNAEIAGKLGSLATPALKGLFAVMEAAQPMTNMLVDKFVSFGNTLSNLAQNNGPAMTKFFDNAGRIFMNTTKTLGDFTKGLYEIGKLSVGLGGEMGFGLMDMMAKFRAWTESAAGQNRIKQFFDDIRPPLQAAWQLLVAVGQAFGRISTSGKGFEALTKTFDTLRTSLVPVLEKLLTASQGEIIPKLAEALGSLVDIMMNLNMAGILGGLLRAFGIIATVIGALPAPIQTVLGIMVTIAALVRIIGVGFGFWTKGIGGAIKAMAVYIKQLLAAKFLDTAQGVPGGKSASKGLGKFLPIPASAAIPAAEGAAQGAGVQLISKGAGAIARFGASAAGTVGTLAGLMVSVGLLGDYMQDSAASFDVASKSSDKWRVSLNAAATGSRTQEQINNSSSHPARTNMSNVDVRSESSQYAALLGESNQEMATARTAMETLNQSIEMAVGGGDDFKDTLTALNDQMVSFSQSTNEADLQSFTTGVGAALDGLKKNGMTIDDLGKSLPGVTAAFKTLGEESGQSINVSALSNPKGRASLEALALSVNKVTSQSAGLKTLDQRWSQLASKSPAGVKKSISHLSGLARYARISGMNMNSLSRHTDGTIKAINKAGYAFDKTTGKITKMDAKAKAKRNPIKYQARLVDKATTKMDAIGKRITRLTKKRNDLLLKVKDETNPGVVKITKKIAGLSKKEAKIAAEIGPALTELTRLELEVKKPTEKIVNINNSWEAQATAMDIRLAQPIDKVVNIKETGPGAKETGPGARFAGGPVWSGFKSWVGELGPELWTRPGMAPEMVGVHGPELMDFHSDGMIIPNHMLPEEATAGSVRSAPMQVSSSIHTGGGGAGNAINIANVNMTQEMDLTRELVRAQRAMERDKRERAIRPINGRRG